jgi:hypothetical protein
MNMHNVLDKQYYSQLKNINTAYCNTTPIKILEHLDTRWCPINIQARKILKDEYYTDWNSSDVHITTFWDEAQHRAEPTRQVVHHHQQQGQATVLP